MSDKIPYNTVGELVAFLQTLDPAMPTTQWGSGDLFMRGIEVEIRKLRKLVDEPHYAVLKGDRTFKITELDKPFDAAVFG